jgi:hypothetical protein
MTSHNTESTTNTSSLEDIKKLAKRKQKETGCSYSNALEIISKESGYKDWHHAQNFFKNSSVAEIMPAIDDIKLILIKADKQTRFSVFPTSETPTYPNYLQNNISINIGMLRYIYTGEVKLWVSNVAYDYDVIDKNLKDMPPYQNYKPAFDREWSEVNDQSKYVDAHILLIEIGASLPTETYRFFFTDKNEYHRVMGYFKKLYLVK